MKDEVLKHLLTSNPWTEYRTRIDLLEEPLDSDLVLTARKKMISHPQVGRIKKRVGGRDMPK